MGDRSFAVGFGFGLVPVILAYFQGWLWLPDVLSWEDVVLLATAVFVTFVNYLNEYHQLYPLQYSKFSVEGSVPARVGWFLMYFSPLCVYLLVWRALGAPNSSYDLLILTMYCLHFVKRCLETIFVHKYSKDCLFVTVIQISGLYSFSAVVTSYSVHHLVGTDRYSFLEDNTRVTVGLCVYAAGQLCNLSHHVLLARMRTPGSFKYVVPQGGLFSLVVCPQYLGELLAWLGFAITSYTYGSYLSYVPMVAYLCARAHHTFKWYASKFDDYPGSTTYKVWPLIY